MRTRIALIAAAGALALGVPLAGSASAMRCAPGYEAVCFAYGTACSAVPPKHRPTVCYLY